MMRTGLMILLVASVVAARPPKARGFTREDNLHFRLAEKLQKLEAKEQFEAKPRIEKIIILFQNLKPNDSPYFGKDKDRIKLVGDVVATEVIEKWKDVQVPREKVSEENLRILNLLIPAMQARYGRGLDVDKKERYDASKVLVDALTSDYLHIRTVAIDCLKVIYRNQGRFYQPNAPKKDRIDKQKRWRKFIRDEYRGR